jgi:hypothetical protein
MAPALNATMSILFDRRGALVASAFFLGLFLILAILFLVNLRHERLGRFGLSRQVRIVGFSTLAALYLVTLYGWLFWRTFYDLRVAPGASRLELTVLMPERRLAWPLEQIESIRKVPGSRAGFARLMIETRDGCRYRSPDRAAVEIAEALDGLRRSLKGARSAAPSPDAPSSQAPRD